ELQSRSHRGERLVVAGLRVRLAEVPRRLLAQDPGGLAALVDLDDAARHFQVAVRARERGRVEPGRVGVLREEEGRRVAGDGVESLTRRLLAPVRIAPAEAANPPFARRRVPHAREGLVERRRALEPDLALRERPA